LTTRVLTFIIRQTEDRIMNVVAVSRIVGTFLGYAPGVVYRLDDGTEWEQVGRAEEYVYRERPQCRVFWDWERLYIDVQGTSGGVELRRYMGKRWAGAGAY
jgi:hypothetical protein